MKAGRNCLGRRRKTTQTDIKPRRLRAAAAGLNRRAAHPACRGNKQKKSPASGRRPYPEASASGLRQGSKPEGPRPHSRARSTRARRPAARPDGRAHLYAESKTEAANTKDVQSR